MRVLATDLAGAAGKWQEVKIRSRNASYQGVKIGAEPEYWTLGSEDGRRAERLGIRK
nr:hypothetical protein [uncultured Acetatifactor sp.]